MPFRSLLVGCFVVAGVARPDRAGRLMHIVIERHDEELAKKFFKVGAVHFS